jgi:hypothetical protein
MTSPTPIPSQALDIFKRCGMQPDATRILARLDHLTN